MIERDTDAGRVEVRIKCGDVHRTAQTEMCYSRGADLPFFRASHMHINVIFGQWRLQLHLGGRFFCVPSIAPQILRILVVGRALPAKFRFRRGGLKHSTSSAGCRQASTKKGLVVRVHHMHRRLSNKTVSQSA
jgi:hypothetical protein